MFKHNIGRGKRQAGRDGTPIYVGRVVVGRVVGGVFRKSIAASKHILRQPRAIAFDVSTLADAEAAGAVAVEVRDRETGHGYTASIALIRERGISINRGGYGRQIALLVSEFTMNGRPPTAPPAPEDQPRQMGFGL